MAVRRLPLPSNLDTYYINQELRLHAFRDWLRDSRVGVDLRVARNEYGDRLSVVGEPPDPNEPPRPNEPAEPEWYDECRDFIRVDDRLVGEAYIEWTPDSRLRLRLGASAEDRDSNCRLLTYESSRLLVGVSYGWN
jgi:hypothetical protein